MKAKDLINVLVTGVGGGGHGHEILKALQFTGRYRIVATDMSDNSLGLYDVEDAYVIPPASDPNYVDTLLELCCRFEIRAVFHGSEPELKIMSSNRERFTEAKILLPINTNKIIQLCMDKWATYNYLKEKGFDVPKTQLVENEQEIPALFPIPAVVRPSRGGGGSSNTFVAQDMNEIQIFCHHLLRNCGHALIQEYVGTPNDEFTVGVLHTLDGDLVGSIALRRHILSGLSNRVKTTNRTGRSDLSKVLAISSGISQGIVDEFPEVRTRCEEISQAFLSKGPMNIQCRYVQGRVLPFEINPRFSGTTYIRALFGFNEPDIIIRHHLLGEAIKSPIHYRFGRVVRGLREQITEAKRSLLDVRA